MAQNMKVRGDTAKWSVLLGELAAELEKFGMKDFTLPTWDKSYEAKRVTVNIADKAGNWKPLSCASQSSPEKNLKALCVGIKHARLAEAWGVGVTVVDALQLKALASGKKSPYAVLGVREGETDQAILLSAFRQRAKATHPDLGGEPKDFLAVQHAAEVLGVVDR